ncbi:hypothetical protein [Cypionkella sp.]|uniref:hypothetical protein n=1 Tax=Cypionkella sp. TaxID=2811411 RepID=UPI00261B4499|nr:hypothetical protein [Cypionkella sp.]MDB5665910.1 hypothetical protein [Cypionkella sp.]
MSAPNTNPEKQARQHRGPLIGMALAVAIGVGAIGVWLLHEASNADEQQGEETDIPADVETAPQPSTSVSPTAPGTPEATPQTNQSPPTIPSPATDAAPNDGVEGSNGNATTQPPTNP